MYVLLFDREKVVPLDSRVLMEQEETEVSR